MNIFWIYICDNKVQKNTQKESKDNKLKGKNEYKSNALIYIYMIVL